MKRHAFLPALLLSASACIRCNSACFLITIHKTLLLSLYPCIANNNLKFALLPLFAVHRSICTVIIKPSKACKTDALGVEKIALYAVWILFFIGDVQHERRTKTKLYRQRPEGNAPIKARQRSFSKYYPKGHRRQ